MVPSCSTARVPSFSYTSMPMPMPMPVHTINSSVVHRPLSSKQLGSQMIQPSKPRRTLQVSTGPAHAGTAVSGCYTMPTKKERLFSNDRCWLSPFSQKGTRIIVLHPPLRLTKHRHKPVLYHHLGMFRAVVSFLASYSCSRTL